MLGMNRGANNRHNPKIAMKTYFSIRQTWQWIKEKAIPHQAPLQRTQPHGLTNIADFVN
jgi:hypothetical protein